MSFRASDGDLRDMERAFRDLGARFLAYYHESDRPAFVSSLDRKATRDPIVWLAREDDLEAIRFKHVPAQSHWLVDQLRSPVVELSRGDAARPGSAVGRLHFDTGYYRSDGAKQDFALDFVNWAAGLLAYVRKHFVRDRSSGVYDGPLLISGDKESEG